ncbi:MAG: hypothetical protein E4H10_10425 [Bacteroidia bacterium]|nr:MAG: hypothetical protein E4H10_10425 [Bacteroidia bacterium]
MAEKKNQLLKITLVLYSIITLVYGVNYLFFPEFQIKITGGEPILAGWIRWFGGVLLALGFGSIMILRNPVKQGIFVTSLCIGSILVSLTLFYEVIFIMDSSFNMLSTLIPAIVLTITSILFLLSLRQSKEILW